MFRRLFSFLCGLFVTVGYAANPTSSEGRSYNIGDFAEGGVIFWLTPDGKHGLVASIDNMGGPGDGSTYLWSTDTVLIGAKMNDLSRGRNWGAPGQINTALILAHYEGTGQSAPAAQACADYSITVNGVTYNDWFLPCVEDLGAMLTQRTVIESVSQAHGGAPFVSASYWASFENTNGTAWVQSFLSGAQSNSSSKSAASLRVRAARAF